MVRAPHPPRRGEDGFILVAVLWILLALASFVGVYALYVSSTVAEVSRREEDLALGPLATAALELTAFRLSSQTLDGSVEEAPTRGQFSFRLGKARISVDYVNEAARIDLNAAPRELLAALFAVLGLPEEAADEAARRVIAWRSADDTEVTSADDAPYRDGQLGYRRRGAPFVHADELWRVAGLAPDLVAAALPHLTVFSGRAEVNEVDADPVVQAAIAATRKAENADEDAPQPERSDALRVTIRLNFDSGRQRTIEAVILMRDFKDAPYRVLAWREDQLPPAAAPTAPMEKAGSEGR